MKMRQPHQAALGVLNEAVLENAFPLFWLYSCKGCRQFLPDQTRVMARGRGRGLREGEKWKDVNVVGS